MSQKEDETPEDFIMLYSELRFGWMRILKRLFFLREQKKNVWKF